LIWSSAGKILTTKLTGGKDAGEEGNFGNGSGGKKSPLKVRGGGPRVIHGKERKYRGAWKQRTCREKEGEARLELAKSEFQKERFTGNKQKKKSSGRGVRVDGLDTWQRRFSEN